LQKRHDFKEPTNRSHPIVVGCKDLLSSSHQSNRPLSYLKEAYTYQKRPMYQKRPTNMKRDLRMKRDLYQKRPAELLSSRVSAHLIPGKRPSYTKRDLYISKETYIYQKRPKYIKRELYIKRDLYISQETC